MLSTADDVARLRAEETIEGGGDGWRRSPLRVVDFEARVEGIALAMGWCKLGDVIDEKDNVVRVTNE